MEQLLHQYLQQQSIVQNRGFLIDIIGIFILSISVFLVLIKINKHTKEISKTHDWNRRKASQEACYEFMHDPIHLHWNLVEEAILYEKKRFDKLSDGQKKSMYKIMDFFENIGISLKHNIMEADIIYDFFQSIWLPCYEATLPFIEKKQIERQDNSVFYYFAFYAKVFKNTSNELKDDLKKDAQRQVGKVPPKEKITGESI